MSAGSLRKDDARFVVDPAHALPPGTGAVYHDRTRLGAVGSRAEPEGVVVANARDARAAHAAGADFLLVIDRAGAADELADIAALGLPWYLNVAAAGDPDAPPSTGRVWWPSSAAGDAPVGTRNGT